ncbi:MAG: glycosyltransferase family 2 protein [Bacteroidetes bacterium]|nr:glycosyltransferase family 2 protein [Bacteroidota bacterium]
MIRLSVVIITFNEEKNIERCIRSVEGIADEIVVVDSFSTDSTEAICNRLGATFIQHPFEGYIEQKNFALQQAGCEYIFSLDADEELSEELKASVLEAKSNGKHECYSMNRLANYCGHWIRHGSWYPDKKTRLFKKGRGNWGGKNPHDKYLPENPGDAGFLKGDILHYSYDTIEEHIAQVNRFSTIGAKSACDAGRHSGILKILFKPLFKFIRDYFFRFGFLDGYYGLVVCCISTHETFLKYVKLRELNRSGE